MSVPPSLRSLLFLTWLVTSAAAQDTTSSNNRLTIPGLPATAPSPSVVDTVNMFRGHQDLRTQLDAELARLSAEDGVDLWLVTASFQTRQSPAQEASEIVGAWSGDRPAIVLIYIRGNRGTGIAANDSLQEIVPSFELASALPTSAVANSPTGSESAPDTAARVTSLTATTHKITELVRRYTSGGPAKEGSRENATEKSSNAASAAASSPRKAESVLLIAVLAIAAIIVWLTARTTRI